MLPQTMYRLLRWCPGILGLLLRQKLYRFLLGSCGRGVLIGRCVDIVNPGGIAIADNVILNDGSCLDAGPEEAGGIRISLGKGVFIGAFTALHAVPGRISIGEGGNIGSRCRITATSDVLFADHVLLAGYCLVGETPPEAADGDAHPAAAQAGPTRTSIGRGSWLGLRCQVRAGSSIGEGTIVGAHAVVAGSLPEYAIAVGQPAMVKRLRP